MGSWVGVSFLLYSFIYNRLHQQIRQCLHLCFDENWSASPLFFCEGILGKIEKTAGEANSKKSPCRLVRQEAKINWLEGLKKRSKTPAGWPAGE
jgi:hypothetical protein